MEIDDVTMHELIEIATKRLQQIGQAFYIPAVRVEERRGAVERFEEIYNEIKYRFGDTIK